MTQNGDENAKFQLWEILYGHIRFQHYHIYQKPRERKRSMQPVDILGGLLKIHVWAYNHGGLGPCPASRNKKVLKGGVSHE